MPASPRRKSFAILCKSLTSGKVPLEKTLPIRQLEFYPSIAVEARER
jgi:hypothetical protein